MIVFLSKDKKAINHAVLGCYPDTIAGRQYTKGAMVLDWRMHDDDHIDLLLIEETDEVNQHDEPTPFVAVRLHLDVLDVRTELWRESSFRYAFIQWEEGE